MKSSKPQIVFMPHGNLQYSQLPPEKRGWVIHESYEKLFDLVEQMGVRIGFEGSGQTIEMIGTLCPDVLVKLKRLIAAGQVEPVGSPHTHIMLSNIDPEIGLENLKEGLDSWEKWTGVRPSVGWNPECGWASYIPEIYKEAGYNALVMDADSFLLSYPAIREATGLSFDVQGHSNKNNLFRIEKFIQDKEQFLRYLTNPSVAPNGLKMIFRSDMMSNLMLWYLMGATEGVRTTPVSLVEVREMLARWYAHAARTGTFIMPYAEDAEYIGTSAYFYVKQFGQARFFEPEPASVTRFRELLSVAAEVGYQFATPSEAITAGKTVIENPDVANIDNGVAWHGGTAKAWANTPYSRIIDPVCRSVFDGIKAVQKKLGGKSIVDPQLKSALKKVTSAYVSDCRWPPAPTSPGRFNVREALTDLREANTLIADAMVRHHLENQRSLYSPDLMMTEINCIDRELMALAYFGEK